MISCSGGKSGSPDEPDVPGEVTPKTLEGWRTKPEGFEGITFIQSFLLDAESSHITAYGEYGNALDEYPRFFNDDGLSIDLGETLGISAFIFSFDSLLDSEGNIHYVRGGPVNFDDAPYSLADMYGVWLKESLMLFRMALFAYFIIYNAYNAM